MKNELIERQVEGSAQCFKVPETNACDLQNSNTLLVPETILTRREGLITTPCNPSQYGVRLGNPIIPQTH